MSDKDKPTFPPGYLSGQSCVYCKHFREVSPEQSYLWGCHLATFVNDERDNSPYNTNNCQWYQEATQDVIDARQEDW